MEIDKDCNHCLNIVEENWMSTDTVLITVKCDVCENKFRGLVTKT